MLVPCSSPEMDVSYEISNNSTGSVSPWIKGKGFDWKRTVLCPPIGLEWWSPLWWTSSIVSGYEICRNNSNGMGRQIPSLSSLTLLCVPMSFLWTIKIKKTNPSVPLNVYLFIWTDHNFYGVFYPPNCTGHSIGMSSETTLSTSDSVASPESSAISSVRASNNSKMNIPLWTTSAFSSFPAVA